MAKDTTKGQRKAKRFQEKHGFKKSAWPDMKKKLRKEGKGSEINKILKNS